MGTINMVGSLRYDMHGRKRKTNSLSKARSSSRSRTLGFHPSNVGSNPARATNQEVLEKARVMIHERTMGDFDRAKEMERVRFAQEKREISKNYTIAPAYNKGAYQVIPKKDIKPVSYTHLTLPTKRIV